MTFVEKFEAVVAGFDRNPATAQRQMRALLEEDPAAFCSASLPLLRKDTYTQARRQMLGMMMSVGLLPLCDPARMTLEEETRLVRELKQLDPLLDAKLALRLSSATGNGIENTDPAVAERMLELLAAVSDKNRGLPILVQLLKQENPRLRSKAALLVGRMRGKIEMLDQSDDESDGRPRGNSLDQLRGVDTEVARDALWNAAGDPDSRTAGNGLLGLFRLGVTGSIRPLLAMADHEDPQFRSTAAWVMGETGNPRFLPVLGRMIRESNQDARRSVFRAISQLKRVTERDASAPRLQVDICEVKAASGRRLIRASIGPGEVGTNVPALAATDFLVTDDGRMIDEYAVARRRAPQGIVLGLVVPRASAEAAAAAVEKMLELKRQPDRWVVAWYADSGETPEQAGVTNEAARTAVLLAGDPAVLRRRAAPPAGMLPARTAAVQALLGSIGAAAGGRHVVIVDEDQPRESESAAVWESIQTQAKSGSVAIHSIAPAAAAPGAVQGLCDNTAGICLKFGSQDEIAECCRRLYFALLDRYEISYSTEASAGTALKLQVYSERGCGEASVEVGAALLTAANR